MILSAIGGVTQFAFSPYVDDRGVFQRAWDKSVAEAMGMTGAVQVSVSVNPHAFTLRGLHMLRREAHETKSVCCVTGNIQDVLVDMRPESETFMGHLNLVLNAGEGVLIPPGVAHGYLTLSSDVTLTYVMSSEYQSGMELGLNWIDPKLNIDWCHKPRIISSKDASHPFL